MLGSVIGLWAVDQGLLTPSSHGPIVVNLMADMTAAVLELPSYRRRLDRIALNVCVYVSVVRACQWIFLTNLGKDGWSRIVIS